LIVALNMLVYGELDWELDFAFLRMLKIFSWYRDPEVEGDDITVVVAAVGKKQTTRWRMQEAFTFVQ